MRKTVAAKVFWDVWRGRKRGAPSVGERLSALPRMARGSLSGTYPHLSRSRLLMMALAVVYIVSPFDVVPELLLSVFGLADDVLVLGWLTGSVLSETERFLMWERRDRTVQGEVSV